MAVDGQPVAVFNIEGRLYAIGNRCPHRGGPLVRGTLEHRPDTGPAVRCPIHGWLFDLSTGRCINQPAAACMAYHATDAGGMLDVTPKPLP